MDIQSFAAAFSRDYVRNALIIGVLISVCTAILGVELVLKKFSMLGDGLSHVSFGVLAVASSFNFASLELALVAVVFVAFFLLQIRRSSKINGDAAVAIVSGSFMALGVFASTLAGGTNTDFNNYMFGSIFAITKDNMLLSVVMCAVVIAVYALFYNKIFAVTFDEDFCKATGGRAGLYNLIIAVLTAVTIVIGMKLIGTLLIASLTVFPVVSAFRFAKTYKRAVAASAGTSVAAFLMGFAASLLSDKVPLSTGVVFANLLIMLLCFAASKTVAAVRAKKVLRKEKAGENKNAADAAAQNR